MDMNVEFQDFEDVRSTRSRSTNNDDTDIRIELSRPVHTVAPSLSAALNSDEPIPAVVPGQKLQAVLRDVDRQVGKGVRLPLVPSRVASVRIMGDGDARSNTKASSRSDSVY